MRLEDHYKFANSSDCPGKKTFPSYRLAAEFNNRQRSRGGVFVAKGKKVEKMHPYRCKSCNQFHIGHAIRTRPQRLHLQQRHHGKYRREGFRKSE